jgi:hypothetical protein
MLERSLSHFLRTFSSPAHAGRRIGEQYYSQGYFYDGALIENPYSEAASEG